VIRHLGSSPTDVTYVFEGAPADLVAARSTRTEDGLSGID
jgi:hypothetical protein